MDLHDFWMMQVVSYVRANNETAAYNLAKKAKR